MSWPLPYPRRGDLLSILFILFLLCFLASCFYWFPNTKLNFGFGPEWDCAPVPKGDPICIKKFRP
ncbi:hypothetical protein ACQR07_04735 [Bradyrhizobium sp. HKCCYLS20291]